MKNDRVDWQAYFHQRNRWVAAFTSKKYNSIYGLALHSFMSDIIHLISMQYTPVKMRNLALKDLLTEREHMHRLFPLGAGNCEL